MQRVRLFIGLLGLLMGLGGCASQAKLTESQRMEAFQFVWEEVQRSHYDPNLGGVDWNAVRDEFAPRVRSAKSDAEFYALLDEMVKRVGQSHMAVIPPNAYVAEEEVRTRVGMGDVGLTVQLVEGRPLITRIRNGSPAKRAGIPPGSEMLAINEEPVERYLERIRERKLSPIEERMQVMLTFMALLSGEPNTKVTIRYRDLNGQEHAVELIRERPPGEISQFGYLPPIPVQVESRRLPGNIGYIRFNMFMPPVMKRLPDIIRSMKNARGLIIDLRGNVGGIGLMAGGVGGYLVDKETPMGVMRLRAGTFGIVANPQSGAYLGPVVILVDELSASTSEIMAGALQEAGRATIIGRPTPGMALPSKLVAIPHGGYLQCVIADFETPKKRRLEGVGVTPDIVVELKQEDFRTTDDPILQRAVEYLQAQRRK